MQTTKCIANFQVGKMGILVFSSSIQMNPHILQIKSSNAPPKWIGKLQTELH
jgi:hypothetical protein